MDSVTVTMGTPLEVLKDRLGEDCNGQNLSTGH